jgi:YbgC/YbaW family acyl-CoA thioester hydrolase
MFKVRWFIWNSLAGRLISTKLVGKGNYTRAIKRVNRKKDATEACRVRQRRSGRPYSRRRPRLFPGTAMPQHRTSRRVEFSDTDMAGIAHYSNFFRWMEAAEVEYLRARGLSVKMEWEGQLIGFPRVAATCDYLAPARFEDLLEIVATLDRVGEKSVTYAFEVFCRGKKLATGKVTSVCCRVVGENHYESIAIPTGYRARLEQESA